MTFNPITIVNNALAKIVFDHMDRIFIDNRLIDQLKLEKWKMPPSIFVHSLYDRFKILNLKRDMSFCAKLQTTNNDSFDFELRYTDHGCLL